MGLVALVQFSNGSSARDTAKITRAKGLGSPPTDCMMSRDVEIGSQPMLRLGLRSSALCIKRPSLVIGTQKMVPYSYFRHRPKMRILLEKNRI